MNQCRVDRLQGNVDIIPIGKPHHDRAVERGDPLHGLGGADRELPSGLNDRRSSVSLKRNVAIESVYTADYTRCRDRHAISHTRSVGIECVRHCRKSGARHHFALAGNFHGQPVLAVKCERKGHAATHHNIEHAVERRDRMHLFPQGSSPHGFSIQADRDLVRTVGNGISSRCCKYTLIGKGSWNTYLRRRACGED